MSTMNSKTFSSVIADGQSEDIIWNIANVCVLQIPINYVVY
jgi:TolB-like protein